MNRWTIMYLAHLVCPSYTWRCVYSTWEGGMLTINEHLATVNPVLPGQQFISTVARRYYSSIDLAGAILVVATDGHCYLRVVVVRVKHIRGIQPVLSSSRKRIFHKTTRMTDASVSSRTCAGLPWGAVESFAMNEASSSRIYATVSRSCICTLFVWMPMCSITTTTARMDIPVTSEARCAMKSRARVRTEDTSKWACTYTRPATYRYYHNKPLIIKNDVISEVLYEFEFKY